MGVATNVHFLPEENFLIMLLQLLEKSTKWTEFLFLLQKLKHQILHSCLTSFFLSFSVLNWYESIEHFQLKQNTVIYCLLKPFCRFKIKKERAHQTAYQIGEMSSLLSRG